MAEKSRVQVVIDGKILTMGGYEDEMHIQRVANYVNHMIQDMKTTDSYRGLPSYMKPILIELNIADELLKANEYVSQLEEDIRVKDDELTELKQALVELQLRLAELEG